MDNNDVNKQAGQSTVEYLLLFAVVATLAAFIFKSNAFDKIFGKNGQFANAYKNELEYTYRHGLYGRTPYTKPNYKSSKHDSYNGRFFGAADPYPAR
ncbi:MAG: hypothetical protein QF441_12140 [Bacteriovoracaceae bacterium]|jgi:hypothetical protein|nr:hypothetical protein [Halobacteriovoraceae bacterium]MDP7321355.1 hypothetical protein [Bacteriovoracaceae bacterium]|tara:strand:+ start:407 stop:697 length:291 start_codon:yes stop_codon:yes gene_type:complete